MGNDSNPILESQIEALARIYEERVLPTRTRVVSLLGRKCQPRLLHTFLGYELKLGRKRITCPDLITARYLQLFAELGMPGIHIPYDPTQTGRLVGDLERPLEKIKQTLLEEKTEERQWQRKMRRVYARIREQLKDAERTSPQPQ